MAQQRAPEPPRQQVGVGDLVAHADREGDVGEVAVVGMVLVAEREPTHRRRVVEVGVAQREVGVHGEPRHDDGGDRRRRQQRRLRSAVRCGRLVQRQRRAWKGDDARRDDDEAACRPRVVLERARPLRLLAVGTSDDRPGDDEVDRRRGDPAGEDRQLPRDRGGPAGRRRRHRRRTARSAGTPTATSPER